jgi:hypothetical protein
MRWMTSAVLAASMIAVIARAQQAGPDPASLTEAHRASLLGPAAAPGVAR